MKAAIACKTAGALLLVLGCAPALTQPQQPSAGAGELRAAAQAGLLVGANVDDLGAARSSGQRAVNGATRAGPGAACFNCHGMNGEGDAAGGFPRLAGLPAFYLAKQLDNYADGSRPNEVMTPIAVQLTEAQRRNIGVYYATLSAALAPVRDRNAELVQQGATLAALGSPARGVQACANCHGPQGIGMPPDVPYLAGQNAQYMELQLQRWHEGRRTNDILGVMRDVATRLSAEERRAVSQYYASLPAPQRPAVGVVQQAQGGQRPAAR